MKETMLEKEQIEEKRNVISFLNMKGGVCKTTLCKEMSVFLAENKNRKVLVIDIDPQANCTQSLFERFNIINLEKSDLITGKSELPSIQNIFNKPKGRLQEIDTENIICKLSDNLHLIPGELDTIFMERDTGGGATEQKLLNFMKKTNLKQEYQYILIDCPPTYSFYTVSALLVSDYYFVPLVPDIYSLLGLDLLERVIVDLKDAYITNFESHKIDNLGVIFTKIPRNTKENNPKLYDNMEGIIKNFDEDKFFESKFYKSNKLVTSKLKTFIIDREDSKLSDNLKEICEEFEKKIGGLYD